MRNISIFIFWFLCMLTTFFSTKHKIREYLGYNFIVRKYFNHLNLKVIIILLYLLIKLHINKNNRETKRRVTAATSLTCV